MKRPAPPPPDAAIRPSEPTVTPKLFYAVVLSLGAWALVTLICVLVFAP